MGTVITGPEFDASPGLRDVFRGIYDVKKEKPQAMAARKLVGVKITHRYFVFHYSAHAVITCVQVGSAWGLRLWRRKC